MRNPGGLATLITMLVPVCIALALSRTTSSWLRGLAWASLVLAVASVGPLDSKSGQVGILLAPLIFAGLLLTRRIRGTGYRKTAFVALGAAAIFLLVLLGIQVLASAGVADWDLFVEESSFGFRPGRLERIRQLALMFGQHPVAGTGVGTFTLLLPSFYERYGAPVGGETVLEATNHGLHVAATGGVIGLAATLWLLVAFVLPAVRGLACAAPDGASQSVGIAALAGVLAYLVVTNWQGETFYYIPVASVFWILVGLAAGTLGRPPATAAGVLGAPAVYAVTALGGLALLLHL